MYSGMFERASALLCGKNAHTMLTMAMSKKGGILRLTGGRNAVPQLGDAVKEKGIILTGLFERSNRGLEKEPPILFLEYVIIFFMSTTP